VGLKKQLYKLFERKTFYTDLPDFNGIFAAVPLGMNGALLNSQVLNPGVINPANSLACHKIINQI